MDHSQLYVRLWISASLIAATIFVHALFVAAAIFRSVKGPVWGVLRFLRDGAVIVALALFLMVAPVAEIVMWALTFLRFGLFEHLEAANGLLLFGLSAAFLFDAAGQLRLAGPHNR